MDSGKIPAAPRTATFVCAERVVEKRLAPRSDERNMPTREGIMMQIIDWRLTVDER